MKFRSSGTRLLVAAGWLTFGLLFAAFVPKNVRTFDPAPRSGALIPGDSSSSSIRGGVDGDGVIGTLPEDRRDTVKDRFFAKMLGLGAPSASDDTYFVTLTTADSHPSFDAFPDTGRDEFWNRVPPPVVDVPNSDDPFVSLSEDASRSAAAASERLSSLVWEKDELDVPPMIELDSSAASDAVKADNLVESPSTESLAADADALVSSPDTPDPTGDTLVSDPPKEETTTASTDDVLPKTEGNDLVPLDPDPLTRQLSGEPTVALKPLPPDTPVGPIPDPPETTHVASRQVTDPDALDPNGSDPVSLQSVVLPESIAEGGVKTAEYNQPADAKPSDHIQPASTAPSLGIPTRSPQNTNLPGRVIPAPTPIAQLSTTDPSSTQQMSAAYPPAPSDVVVIQQAGATLPGRVIDAPVPLGTYISRGGESLQELADALRVDPSQRVYFFELNRAYNYVDGKIPAGAKILVP